MGELLKFEGELTKPSVERKAEKPNSLMLRTGAEHRNILRKRLRCSAPVRNISNSCKKRGCSFETASSK